MKNIIIAGGNYGWPFIEGDQPGPRAAEAPPGFAATAPVVFFPIGDVSPGSNFFSRALIGGTVYRGSRLPGKPQTLVSIEYIESLGDWKTAWDHIHFRGFLGTPMTMQFTWQGCDSLLAAPLAVALVGISTRPPLSTAS